MKIINSILFILFLSILPAGFLYGGGFFQEVFLAASLNNESDINPDPEFPEFSSDESDSRFSIEGEYLFDMKITEKDSAGFALGAGLNMYMTENDFDNSVFSISGFYKREQMGPFTFFGNLRYGIYNVDGSAYVNTINLSPALFWKHSEAFTSIFKFRFLNLNYNDFDSLSGNDIGFEFKELWLMNSTNELAGSIFVNQASLDDDIFSYFGFKITVEYIWFAAKEWKVQGVLSIGNKSFEEDWPGEGEAREETYIDLTVSTDYDFGSIGKVFGGITYFNNMSNVDTFDIDRVVISAGYIYTIKF